MLSPNVDPIKSQSITPHALGKTQTPVALNPKELRNKFLVELADIHGRPKTDIEKFNQFLKRVVLALTGIGVFVLIGQLCSHGYKSARSYLKRLDLKTLPEGAQKMPNKEEFIWEARQTKAIHGCKMLLEKLQNNKDETLDNNYFILQDQLAYAKRDTITALHNRIPLDDSNSPKDLKEFEALIQKMEDDLEGFQAEIYSIQPKAMP